MDGLSRAATLATMDGVWDKVSVKFRASSSSFSFLPSLLQVTATLQIECATISGAVMVAYTVLQYKFGEFDQVLKESSVFGATLCS